MLVYHGTLAKHADAAKRKGLIPRYKGKGNWCDRPGRRDCVYLTSVYGGMYALAAKGRDRRRAIIEVDLDTLDEQCLWPDEDFVADCVYRQSLLDTGRMKPSRQQQEMEYEQVVLKIRKELAEYAEAGKVPGDDWKHLKGWEASLKHHGTCAFHGKVPASAIRRIVYLPGGAHPLLSHFRNKNLSIAVHAKQRDQMEACTRWAFDGYSSQIAGLLSAGASRWTRNGFEVWPNTVR